MNVIEHLVQCLGEEGAEISQDCSKMNRFGVTDRNFLNPTGPSNVQRLVDELNDLLGVVEMLVERGVIPPDWESAQKKEAKKQKVLTCMNYAESKGVLQR